MQRACKGRGRGDGGGLLLSADKLGMTQLRLESCRCPPEIVSDVLPVGSPCVLGGRIRELRRRIPVAAGIEAQRTDVECGIYPLENPYDYFRHLCVLLVSWFAGNIVPHFRNMCKPPCKRLAGCFHLPSIMAASWQRKRTMSCANMAKIRAMAIPRSSLIFTGCPQCGQSLALCDIGCPQAGQPFSMGL